MSDSEEKIEPRQLSKERERDFLELLGAFGDVSIDCGNLGEDPPPPESPKALYAKREAYRKALVDIMRGALADAAYWRKAVKNVYVGTDDCPFCREFGSEYYGREPNHKPDCAWLKAQE